MPPSLADIFSNLAQYVMLVGLATTRIAVAFMVLPLFSTDLVPAMVRNAVFTALAVVSIAMQPPLPVETLDGLHWVLLFAKEAVLGLAIGALFGIFLWAFETAGQMIDLQIGISNGQVMDPLTGQQVSLIGAFLGRLANFVFMAGGGLLLLVGVLMESFALWPIGQAMPELRMTGLDLFASEFGNFFSLAFLIAAPVLVILFAIDSIMGMVNRYAQQLNVSFLSSSLKGVAAIIVLLGLVLSLVRLLIDEMMRHAGQFPDIIKGLFVSS